MDGRSEFLVFMGAALGTTLALFVAQQVYASYLDVHVVHGAWEGAPRDAKIVAKHAAEQQALQGGKMPIDKAMQALAQRGRGASNRIAPVQSDDVSAMSGWIHRRDFAPYAPRQAAAAQVAPAEPAAVEGGEESATSEETGAQPVDAAAVPGVAKPAAEAHPAPHAGHATH